MSVKKAYTTVLKSAWIQLAPTSVTAMMDLKLILTNALAN